MEIKMANQKIDSTTSWVAMAPRPTHYFLFLGTMVIWWQWSFALLIVWLRPCQRCASSYKYARRVHKMPHLYASLSDIEDFEERTVGSFLAHNHFKERFNVYMKNQIRFKFSTVKMLFTHSPITFLEGSNTKNVSLLEWASLLRDVETSQYMLHVMATRIFKLEEEKLHEIIRNPLVS